MSIIISTHGFRLKLNRYPHFKVYFGKRVCLFPLPLLFCVRSLELPAVPYSYIHTYTIHTYTFSRIGYFLTVAKIKTYSFPEPCPELGVRRPNISS
jgi:hypothetical protein